MTLLHHGYHKKKILKIASRNRCTQRPITVYFQKKNNSPSAISITHEIDADKSPLSHKKSSNNENKKQINTMEQRHRVRTEIVHNKDALLKVKNELP